MGVLREIAGRLAAEFSPEAVVPLVSGWLADVVVAGITVGVFVVGWWVVRATAGHVLARSRLDATARTFVVTVLRFVVATVAIIAALGVLGVNTAALVTSLGVAGLTIGFAARDALSNVISGIFIFLDRPFTIGDLVEVGDFYGRVDRITMRSTRVVTPDGKMLAIPNTEMVNQIVTSYTNFPNLRLDVAVTVAPDTDLGRARAVLLAAVADDPAFLADPAPRVVVTALHDYNVELELQAWIADERQHIGRRFALREAIFEALTEAGVEMPLETFELAPIEIRRTEPGG